MRLKLGFALFLGVALCAPHSVLAGFDAALAAYRNKNYATAVAEARQAAASGDARGSFLLGVLYQSGQGVAANSTEAHAWYEKASQGGVVGAYSKLAQMHMRGDGVPKNPEKALDLARLSSRLGDPEGMFLVHIILQSSALGYADASGKVNQEKYRQLSGRPVSERAVDTESIDALYRASDNGYPLAILTLALKFGGTVGEGNRERMLHLAGKIPQHTYTALKNYEKLARHINGLGQSLTTPQLFLDAQLSQTLAAMLKTCGLPDKENKDAPKPAAPELIGMAISKPLANAVYLPSKVPGYERSYLVAGEWEEDWTYRGCGQTATVTVKFAADGLGGAHLRSEQRGNEIPGLSKQ